MGFNGSPDEFLGFSPSTITPFDTVSDEPSSFCLDPVVVFENSSNKNKSSYGFGGKIKMEVNEATKIAIARPVASRPQCPIYKSFSELLAGAVDISSTNVHSEMVTAIRPKTVRLKPATNHALVGELSSQVGVSEAPVGCRSDNILQSVDKPKVLYKPIAKLAPRKTIPLLENKGSSVSDQRREIAEAQAQAHVQSANEVKQQRDLKTESKRSLLAKSVQDKKTVQSTLVSESTEEVPQSLINTSNVDRPSYDGYNWRKYGQKQVKGSEYPRSYYKCTHLKCPVKKKVERSYDGQIAEIVYRGEHNHPKPQPPKRNLSDGHGRATLGNASKETNNPAWSNQHPQTSEGHVCRIDSQNGVGLTIHSAHSSKAPYFYDPIAAAGMHTAFRNSEDSAEGSKKLEATSDEPKTKRRKIKGQSNGEGTSGESKIPNIPNQSTTDSEITEDGFRWRKYGQKVVKGSSYPRSYYRCTSPKCSMRKFVERTMDDPKAYITTYEGKHNHGIPNRRPNSEVSKTSSKSSSMKEKS